MLKALLKKTYHVVRKAYHRTTNFIKKTRNKVKKFLGGEDRWRREQSGLQ